MLALFGRSELAADQGRPGVKLGTGAITLAQKYPDVFHANVIRSRQAENEVYDALLRLAAKPSSPRESPGRRALSAAG